MICDMDCLNCKFEDCINDNLAVSDYNDSKALDIEFTDKPRDSHETARYLANKRYRERHKEELREKDRLRYKGKRKEDNILRCREFYKVNAEEENSKDRAQYWEKKMAVG